MAIQLSKEYARTYYDPRLFARWKRRFGLEFTLIMDAVCIRSLLHTKGRTPLVILFDGDPRRMDVGTEIRVSAPIKNPKEKPSVFDKNLPEDMPGKGYMVIVVHSKAA